MNPSTSTTTTNPPRTSSASTPTVSSIGAPGSTRAQPPQGTLDRGADVSRAVASGFAVRMSKRSMRFTFLDPHAQAFYPEWARTARPAVGALRIAAARNPHDQHLINLIGELSMRSDAFRTWWAAQDLYVHRHGTKLFRHPAIGELEPAYEALELPGDEALTIVTYSAEPRTPSGDGLQLLAAWAATQDSHLVIQPTLGSDWTKARFRDKA